MKRKGRRFETVSDIQRESQAVLDSFKKNDFHSAFDAWKKRRDQCIRSQGDYMTLGANLYVLTALAIPTVLYLEKTAHTESGG
jgi:hypothetical protein